MLLDIFIFVVSFLYVVFLIGWFIYIYYVDIDKFLYSKPKPKSTTETYKPDLSKIRRPGK